MTNDHSQYDASAYKQITVEGTRDALVASFVRPSIHSEAEIILVGRELLSALDIAAGRDMPLVVSFRGVDSICSALIGKLVLVNRKAKAAGVGCRLADVSGAVADVFRKIWPGGGPAGAMAVLKPSPKDGGGHAIPPANDDSEP